MVIMSIACSYMKDHNLISYMLEKSQLNRRLDSLSMLINDLFHQVGIVLKEISDNTEYLLDSFPVTICDPTDSPLTTTGGTPATDWLTTSVSLM